MRRAVIARELEDGGHIEITAKLVEPGDPPREGSPRFAVTCDGWHGEAGRGGEFGGTMHETVAGIAPELAPVVAVHLCDVNGEPMHAISNARYHLENGDRIGAAKSLHVDLDRLPADLSPGGVEQFAETLRPIWRERAAEAVRIIDELAREEGSQPSGAHKLDGFIAENGLSATVEPVDSNPTISDFVPGARHFSVTITSPNGALTVPYSQGPAHEHEPTLGDVLDMLAMDAQLVEDSDDFEAFLSNVGGSEEDGRHFYELAREQSRQLRELLGNEPYELITGGF